jgi:hypothetical protein
MDKKLAFLWLKVAFMLGSLVTVFYVMTYLKSGTAFKEVDSPAQILLGTSQEQPPRSSTQDR